MEKPISKWTLEGIHEYCTNRECANCIFRGFCSSKNFFRVAHDKDFWDWAQATSLPEPVSSEKPLGQYTLDEIKRMCISKKGCNECYFNRGRSLEWERSCAIAQFPSLWNFATTPIIFTETEKEIAKSLTHLAPKDLENFQLFVSEDEDIVRAGCHGAVYRYIFPIDLFPTMQAHNLKSVTLAEILKKDNDA